MSKVQSTDVLSTIVGDGLTADDLKKSVLVNINDLIGECVLQPYLYAVVGKMAADDKIAYKRAVSELELVKSSIELLMRKDPDKFRISKITDKSVAAALDSDDTVLAAKEEVLIADAQVQASNVLVNVFEQRKAMLKGEVELFTTRLYNETNVRNKEIGETREAIADKRAEAAREKD